MEKTVDGEGGGEGGGGVEGGSELGLVRCDRVPLFSNTSSSA